jgi:hypothetical protein
MGPFQSSFRPRAVIRVDALTRLADGTEVEMRAWLPRVRMREAPASSGSA